MPRVHWPLNNERPAIQVALTLATNGGKITRNLLADTSAGALSAPFELLLDETDCLLCNGTFVAKASLGGAYSGSFPIYLIRVENAGLPFDHDLLAVGVPTVPSGFDGIACFRFLNRFTYGNFGQRDQFGLEA